MKNVPTSHGEKNLFISKVMNFMPIPVNWSGNSGTKKKLFEIFFFKFKAEQLSAVSEAIQLKSLSTQRIFQQFSLVIKKKNLPSEIVQKYSHHIHPQYVQPSHQCSLPLQYLLQSLLNTHQDVQEGNECSQ